MKPHVFIDTGFWAAWMDSRDQHHKEALRCAPCLDEERVGVTSDFVVYETITYLNCSLKAHALALEFLDFLEESGVPVRRADGNTVAAALKLFRQYADKDFSFTDCVSFAVMKNEGITQYAGFDEHFKAMGFQPIASG